MFPDVLWHNCQARDHSSTSKSKCLSQNWFPIHFDIICILHAHEGFTISTVTVSLVPFYHPSNPEPSLLSKWCCNDVCNQSRNRISRQKYWTSNKCCGCCVLTAVVCCCAVHSKQPIISKKMSIKSVLWNKWTWASGNNIWQIVPDDWVRVVLDQLHLES